MLGMNLLLYGGCCGAGRILIRLSLYAAAFCYVEGQLPRRGAAAAERGGSLGWVCYNYSVIFLKPMV